MSIRRLRMTGKRKHYGRTNAKTDMKGNDDKRQHVIPFMKCFTGLVGAFTPEEVIFMLYMADRTRLREKVTTPCAASGTTWRTWRWVRGFRQVRGKDNAYGIA